MSEPDTSAAGEWEVAGCQIDVNRNLSLNVGAEWVAKELVAHHRVSLAALREQLEQAQAALAECYRLTGADPDGNEDWHLAPGAVEQVRRLRQESDESDAKLLSTQAALKKMREELHHVCGALQSSGYKLRPETHAALAIQPDSSALKAVIEEEPEVEALQDGGTCCICDNPITDYDSYGISDKQLHRYHWHCVRREAATVSSPTI